MLLNFGGEFKHFHVERLWSIGQVQVEVLASETNFFFFFFQIEDELMPRDASSD